MNPVVSLVRRLPLSWHERLARAAGRSPGLRAVSRRLAGDAVTSDVTIGAGRGAGLRFNAAGSLIGYAMGTTEPLVQEAFASLLKPGMTVLDCGANVGFFSVIAARAVGPAGRVVAIDPLPANAAAARHNATLNGFTWMEVREAAVGAGDGRASFSTDAKSVHGFLADGGDLDVEVLGLDAQVAAGRLPAPDVIKLDVEGGEVDALAGLRETLTGDRPPVLVIELHETAAPVTAALQAAGYAIARVDDTEPESNAHVIARPGA